MSTAAERLTDALIFGCSRFDEHDHIGDYRVEVIASRDAQIIAWLEKKADEEGTHNKGARMRAAVIRRMADKLSRGAVRPPLSKDATPAPDFYQPGYTYSDTDPEWRFRCDSITTHPESGERTALGWRFSRGEWDAIAYGEDDWDLLKFDGTATTGVPRG